MNKQELVASVALEMDTTKKAAGQAVQAVLECIEKVLASGEDVKLIGFGNFILKERDSRICHNPQNGEEVQVEAKTVVKFKAGKLLKDAVANKKVE